MMMLILTITPEFAEDRISLLEILTHAWTTVGPILYILKRTTVVSVPIEMFAALFRALIFALEDRERMQFNTIQGFNFRVKEV